MWLGSVLCWCWSGWECEPRDVALDEARATRSGLHHAFGGDGMSSVVDGGPSTSALPLVVLLRRGFAREGGAVVHWASAARGGGAYLSAPLAFLTAATSRISARSLLLAHQNPVRAGSCADRVAGYSCCLCSDPLGQDWGFCPASASQHMPPPVGAVCLSMSGKGRGVPKRRPTGGGTEREWETAKSTKTR